jgi:hypothetical protein
VTSASIIVPSASIPAARQNRSKLARTSANASSTAPVAGEPAGVISLVMALLSFVESAPRAYRLKVGNAHLFRNSTEPGTIPRSSLLAFNPLWNELFPAEQSRIIELLVERVDVRTDRVDIKLRIDGVTLLLGELTGNSITQQDAA